MEKRSLIIATVKSRVLEAFEVTHEKFDKTLQLYLRHAQYGKVLHDLDQLVQDKRMETIQTKPITKTEAIEAMKTVEDKKVEIIARIQKAPK